MQNNIKWNVEGGVNEIIRKKDPWSWGSGSGVEASKMRTLNSNDQCAGCSCWRSINFWKSLVVGHVSHFPGKPLKGICPKTNGHIGDSSKTHTHWNPSAMEVAHCCKRPTFHQKRRDYVHQQVRLLGRSSTYLSLFLLPTWRQE